VPLALLSPLQRGEDRVLVLSQNTYDAAHLTTRSLEIQLSNPYTTKAGAQVIELLAPLSKGSSQTESFGCDSVMCFYDSCATPPGVHASSPTA
jgi:hypothetical protein